VPSKQTVLKLGDVVSVDVAVLLDGWYAHYALNTFPTEERPRNPKQSQGKQQDWFLRVSEG
jgi:methionine aminopeptidase